MHIVTVYPIIKGAFKQELTYWSAQNIPLGSIIQVPLKGRKIHALVGEIIEASNAKSQIKQASFATRKIENPNPIEKIPRACVSACIEISHLYSAHLGAVLKSCIPETAFTYDPKNIDSKKGGEDLKKESTASDILIYQTNSSDRLSTYKSIVREEFARKKSVLIIAPTAVSALELHTALKKGVDDYAFCIHGKLSKKKQLDAWRYAVELEHSVLVITTPFFACIPRSDFSTMIIEKESSRGYINMRAPFIDYRDYIEKYAKASNARLILGDSMLRVETLYRRDTGEVTDFFPVSFRIEKNQTLVIVDMNKKDEESADQTSSPGNSSTSTPPTPRSRKDKKDFKILSPELVSMIEHAEKRAENMFIFSARRGLSPQTVCGDCGHSVQCDVCEAPVVLHQTKNPTGEGDMPNRYFLCHHCGKQRSALEACKNCNSWKLTMLGVAIDNTASEIKKQFPKLSIFTLDKDTASTDKQAEDIIKKFENTNGAILLGTESALAFLPEIKYSSIASIDSLFSIPDFKINERIMHILLRMLEKTTGHMLIQTRVKDQPILAQFASGNLLEFYRKEIDMRESVKYPPFTQHIKVTVEDTRASATSKMKYLQDLLDQCMERHPETHLEYMVFPAFVPSSKGKSMLHLLITLPKNIWKKGDAGDTLRSTLLSLPKEYEVRVNPQSLL